MHGRMYVWKLRSQGSRMKEEGFGDTIYMTIHLSQIQLSLMVHNMKEQLHPAIPKKTMEMAIIF